MRLSADTSRDSKRKLESKDDLNDAFKIHLTESGRTMGVEVSFHRNLQKCMIPFLGSI